MPDTIIQLISQTRSFRRFHENRPISDSILHELLNTCRLGGSARNQQSLCYMIVDSVMARSRLFPLLGWAGYLSDWSGPADGERPSAYIICLLDNKRNKGREAEAYLDLGIASQDLLLAAMAKGIGGCRIGSFSHEKVKTLFQVEDRYKILLVIALGYPGETIVLENAVEEEDIKYWRDLSQVHHVPKRSLGDILLPCEFLG